MPAPSKPFQHIYVEDRARAYPACGQILERFPRARVIPIDDYQAVFGRNRQDFDLQKRSPKLILAEKKDQFIYDGSSYVQDFAFSNFHYNALVLNCLYDCRYCYLQGMYPGANIVVFVNLEAFFEAARGAVARRRDPASPLHLAISYDTDLLAMENRLGYVRQWLDFTRRTPGLVTEIRTKSAVWRPFIDVEPESRFIFAWTLSPDAVARAHEIGAPPLKNRLEAARRLGEGGWPLRLCFDPILQLPEAQNIYGSFIDEVFTSLQPEWVQDVSIGVFRVSVDYFKRMKRLDRSPLLYQPVVRQGSAVTYSEPVRSRLTESVTTALRRHIPEEKIFIWT